MKAKLPGLVLCIMTLTTLFSFDTPKGWIKAGNMGSKYETGVWKELAGRKQVAYLRSVDEEINGFGTLMQQFSAANYRGKRLQFSAWVKSEHVMEWAGLWMRVDQNGTTTSLAFDNMQKRPIKGETEWTQYRIVLDVPEYADLISIGALLTGKGQLLVHDVKLNIVDNSIATTTATRTIDTKVYPLAPVNLDFQ